MPGAERMTLGGTVNKTALSLVILLVAASYIWNRGAADPSLPVLDHRFRRGEGSSSPSSTVFKQTWAPYTTPVYAALEGVALGGISVVFEARYPGDRQPGGVPHIRDARRAAAGVSHRP